MQPRLRIGTRGSPLALAQASEVKAALEAQGEIRDIEIVPIRTTGDRIQDRRLLEIGGKGLFTKEIEEALFERRIDLAVHSSKDMPAALPDGLALDHFLEREDPKDAWLAGGDAAMADLPKGAKVGTGSLRRAAQLLRMRPDLSIVSIRGNLDTRIAKLQAGEVAATLLAVAGLKRLGRIEAATSIFEVEQMVPATGQGAIGIETRIDDEQTNDILSAINHPETASEVAAERACLATLKGDCWTPVGILARRAGDRIAVRGRLLSADGAQCFEAASDGPAEDAKRLGREVGVALTDAAGLEFMQSLKDGRE